MPIRKSIDTLLRTFEQKFQTHNNIQISRSALTHNLHLFSNVADKPVIPVLKGNAYGHNIPLVAQALSGQSIPYIAVDGYFEALRIREVSKQPVLIMGAILPQNFAHLKYDKFAFVVQDEPTINALAQTGKPIKVHLECNTGMNRYGAQPDQTLSLAKKIIQHKNLTLEGIMSHLADSDGDDPATVDTAVEQFDTTVDTIRALGAWPTILHIAQTAGSLKAKSKYANTIRLGIGLYGINPFPRSHQLHKNLASLQPALKLTSTITQIIDLKKGDKVSYNYTFTAPRAMRIGTLPIGYYEGLNRNLSNTGHIKIGQKYAAIIGRICMNHTMIDLSDTNAKLGDQVTIYSNNPHDKNAIDQIAHTHNLFNYNLLTTLSPDIRRTPVD